MYRVLIIVSMFTALASAYAADPTQPGNIRKELIKRQTGESLVLNGIIQSDRKKIAIINQKNYQQGDKIGKYTVAAISKHYVDLRYEEDSLRLRIYAAQVKKKVR